MSDPSNIFDQIQSICDEFRRQLRKGVECRIEDYVRRVPESAQGNLFQQLLLIEITHRLKTQEQPSSDDYITRFPQYAKQIRRAFDEASMASADGQPPPPAYEPTFITELRVGEQVGDYKLLKELGEGTFGKVYEASHVGRNDRVALKTLKFEGEPDPERLHRFKIEFRRLAQYNHDHLVGMQTLEYDEGHNQWFFTMELVNGTDFLRYVRPDGELNESRLRAVLPQLVDGISGLHSLQIVPRSRQLVR